MIKLITMPIKMIIISIKKNNLKNNMGYEYKTNKKKFKLE
jgi:hypothetical protein